MCSFYTYGTGGSISIVSPGYNSNYALLISSGRSTWRGVAITDYLSSGFLAYLYAKFPRNPNLGLTYFGIGMVNLNGYSNFADKLLVKISTPYTNWTKFRVVVYYSKDYGCYVYALEKYDESNNTWSSVVSKMFSGKTEPINGYFCFYVESVSTGQSADLYVDNIELYTSKNLFINVETKETEQVSTQT